MNQVVDLLSRRQARGETVLHFTTATEALDYAAQQIRDLERLAGSVLLLDANELDLPLSQVAAILTECRRLHAELRHEENA